MTLFWLSFFESHHETTPELEGVILIEAENLEEAMKEVSMMGMNGGSSAMAYIIEPEHPGYSNLPRNRIIPLEELNRLGYHTEAQRRNMS
jgi:hypothetical protein